MQTIHYQCDQIGIFLKFWAAIFLTKVSQIFGDFLDDWKTSLLSKNCFGYLLGNSWKHLGYFFIPTSGHTVYNLNACAIASKRLPSARSWSSLVEGGEGSYLPNCQTNLVIALYTLSLLFCKFINTKAYHLGRYEPSSPISCPAPRLDILWSCKTAQQVINGRVRNQIGISKWVLFKLGRPKLKSRVKIHWGANIMSM